MFTASRNNNGGNGPRDNVPVPTIRLEGEDINEEDDKETPKSPFTPPTKKSIANTLFPAPNSIQRSLGERRKVVLKPGHSPLDWGALNRKTPKHILRGVPANTPPPQIIKISKDELKKHKVQHDCWTCINGKVFNITPYIDFHPGGVEEIMKCAGRDGTALFYKYHSWVNVDRMLENCMVGILGN
ncbi:cytochrome b5-like heme/steroid binding domain-containing protein [Scheffersomyces coipomensis]|uniref:cytochrome b5-like heme/steroid binding domain-containing protein n=1 Tax=Scheffersomyces coipomensis TaxID=1788519 RepID=UPI00315DB77C